MNRQGSSQEYDREGTLITENFGGLNTESAPNDLPDGDSPNMMNVEVSTNGLLVKRRGTNWRQQHTAAGYRDGRGHTLMPHKLKAGHVVICEKLRTGLRWGVARASAGTPNLKNTSGLLSIGLMPNVFSTRAASSRASWCITPDPVPRLLIATGENTVVEVALYEQLITTTGSSVGTMVITDDVLPFTRFHTTTGTTYTVLIASDGTVTTVNTTSRVGTAVTLNFTGTLPAGSYTVFKPVWYHWTEALAFAPEQLADYVVQPATGSTAYPQLAIEIPEPLRRGITPFNTNGDRPYLMYNDIKSNPVLNSWNSAQTPGLGAAADTSHVYSQGMGAQNGDDIIQSGDTHVVFGRSAGSLPARLIYIVRFYVLPFWDGGARNEVYEIGTIQNVYNNVGRFVPFVPFIDGDRPMLGNGQDWYGAVGHQFTRGMNSAFVNIATGAYNTTGVSIPHYFGMSGSYPFGINDGCMWVFNRKDYAGSSFLHIGTDRQLQDDGYTVGTNNVLAHGAARADGQGYALPIAGLSEFCNFNSTGTYDFPSIITYYQGRVVLSGFKYSPNLVAFSNVTNNYEWFTDSLDREVNRNFSTLYTDAGLGFSPFQAYLDVDTSEEVTNLVSTNDALICFTQNNTISITGVNGANVIPTAYVQNRVSKVGCVNFKCAVNTELGVIFLSRSGVYFLKPVQETGAYSTVNISLKIQRIIDGSTNKNENIAWMAYDQAKSIVYVGISDGVYDTSCTRLLVLNVLRNAWTEYGLTGGYWMSNDGAYIDSRMFIDFNIWADRTTAADNAGNAVNVLELYAFHFMDWCFSDVGNNVVNAVSYSLPIPNHTTYVSMDTNQKNYSTTIDVIPSNCGAVRPIPIRTVLEQDFVNTTSATRYTDWITVTAATGGTAQSAELTADFTTLQVDKTPMDGFVFSDSVGITTGHTLRMRLREYNTTFDTRHPINVTIDNVKWTTSNYAISDASSSTSYSIIPTATYAAAQIVIVGASIPVWWFSPVYDRQQNSRLKRVTHVTTQFRNRDQQLFKPSDRNVAAGQSSSVLTDRFKITADANVAILYDNTFDSTYEMDLYRTSDQLYTFGTDMSATRRNAYARIVSPVIGSSFSLQICVFSFDDSYFELSAYQMVTKPKGRSSRSNQDLR